MEPVHAFVMYKKNPWRSMSSRDNISLGEKIDKPANSTEGLVLLNPGACHIVRQKPNETLNKMESKARKTERKK